MSWKGLGQGIHHGFVQNLGAADRAVVPLGVPRRAAIPGCCDAHKAHRVMVFIGLRTGFTRDGKGDVRRRTAQGSLSHGDRGIDADRPAFA